MLGHSDDLVTGSRAFSPQASWPTPPARGVLSTHERTLDPHIAGGSGHQGSFSFRVLQRPHPDAGAPPFDVTPNGSTERR